MSTSASSPPPPSSCSSSPPAPPPSSPLAPRRKPSTLDTETDSLASSTAESSTAPTPPNALRQQPQNVMEDTTTTTNHSVHKALPTSGNKSCLVEGWKTATARLHRGILACVVGLATRSARNPKRTIGLIAVLSLTILGVGFATNFELALDDEVQFAPTDCRPREHFEWYGQTEGYPTATRPLLMIVHADGQNVMGYAGMQRVFQATQLIRTLPGYYQMCGGGDCRILGPTRYWDDNATIFEADFEGLTPAQSDQQVFDVLSQDTFADADSSSPGAIPIPAAHSFFMGHLERENVYVIDVFGDDDDNDNSTSVDTGFNNDIDTQEGRIIYAESYIITMELPDVTFDVTTVNDDGSNSTTTMTTFEWEILANEALLDLREEWADQQQMKDGDVHFLMDFYTKRSVPDEMGRAVATDLPLLPLVFAIMSIFTCLVFARFHHRVQSRALLGIGSVVTIVCSIMTGFGLAFIIGLPFTNLTQVLPFVIFGVGLDDTFIISGAYFRTNPNDDTVLRIQQTMEEVGASISLTTITTTLAFALGCITSSVPTIQWLCLYAFFTIAIDFIYQISFFVACIVLDEQRIQANRRDCCICFVVPQDEDCDNEEEEIGDETAAQHESEKTESTKPPLAERFMAWYCDILLQTPVKIFVLVSFAAFFAGCCYSATKLTQVFRVEEFLPDESYALSFLDTADAYTDNKLRIMAFFRDVDQSDPEVQRQMIQYIDDLAAMPQIQAQPDFCWVRDFKLLEDSYEANPGANPDFDWIFMGNLTFTERLNLILLSPDAQSIYGSDIARDEEGNIISSRCIFTVNGVDLNDVYAQIDFLADQRKIVASQEANQGQKDFKFFFFDPIYFLWEFYSVAVDELTITTISGILAVAVVAFVLIPHWTASLFVLPMMIILYADLLGTLQFAGMHINPLVCICLITSIGLLVDFVMHVLLRYYESTAPTREEKVKDTLQTMGASILVGGLSTCLGVIPLAFSSSSIIGTMFVLFVSMITIGVAHGLVFLPVVLSICGPLVCIESGHTTLVNEEGKSLTPCGSGASAVMDIMDISQNDALTLRSQAAAQQAEPDFDWNALTQIEC